MHALLLYELEYFRSSLAILIIVWLVYVRRRETVVGFVWRLNLTALLEASILLVFVPGLPIRGYWIDSRSQRRALDVRILLTDGAIITNRVAISNLLRLNNWFILFHNIILAVFVVFVTFAVHFVLIIWRIVVLLTLLDLVCSFFRFNFSLLTRCWVHEPKRLSVYDRGTIHFACFSEDDVLDNDFVRHACLFDVFVGMRPWILVVVFHVLRTMFQGMVAILALNQLEFFFWLLSEIPAFLLPAASLEIAAAHECLWCRLFLHNGLIKVSCRQERTHGFKQVWLIWVFAYQKVSSSCGLLVQIPSHVQAISRVMMGVHVEKQTQIIK